MCASRNAFSRLVSITLLLIAVASTERRSDGEELPVYDAEGQHRRAMEFVHKFARESIDKLDDKGAWAGETGGPWRSLEHSAYVAPLFELGTPEAVKKANAIVENQPVHTLDLAYALVFYGRLMSDAATARAETLVKRDVEGQYQQFRWKSFQGDNDNFQLHAAATVAMWGAYTGERKHIEDARERLEEFKQLLTRRGFASEYNSPAYLPLHLHPLVQIVEAVDDPELKKLAYDLETRTWLDLLCHYHPPSGTQCGPWSREYNFNIYGSSFSRHNLYLLFGDKLAGDWQQQFQSECREHGLVRAANRQCVRYHCPPWLAEWTLNRKYPYQTVGTAEGTASFKQLEPDGKGFLFHWNWRDTADKDGDVYVTPAWNSRIVQFQTADYALGTSSKPFNNSWQNYTFTATLPAAQPLSSTDEIVRVMARYIVDEHKPGETFQGSKPKYSDEQVVFADAGRSVCLQHEKTAMVLYRPDVIVNHKPTSLKAMVYWPKTEFGKGSPRGEIYLGDKRVKNSAAESVDPLPVYVRIGDVYMALIPLINNEAVGVELAREAAVRIRPEGKALGVSFYNFQGEPVELNRRQCCLAGNGFVCEMGSRAKDGSFEEFRKRFAADKYEIFDLYRRTVHSRGAYTRKVVYSRDGLKLDTEYDPVTGGIRYQAINGKTPAMPQLEATDLPRKKVPFLD